MSYHELPPRGGVEYVAAVDPSGGGADAFTLAICHAEGEGDERRIVQDVMRGWGRVGGQAQDLVGVVREIAAICVSYRVGRVTGDRYAAEWVRQAFREAGLIYEDSARTRSQAYLECQPLFATGRIALLDHPVMIRELKCLERRPRAGGQTLVDHPRGQHDDYANSLCLAAALLVEGVGAGLWFQRHDGILTIGRGLAPVQAAAGLLARAGAATMDKLRHEGEVDAELARQRKEDEAKERSRLEAEQIAKWREENQRRQEEERLADIAKQRRLEDADARRLMRDGPWWSSWGGR